MFDHEKVTKHPSSSWRLKLLKKNLYGRAANVKSEVSSRYAVPQQLFVSFDLINPR